jgi:hypothetical protein
VPAGAASQAVILVIKWSGLLAWVLPERRSIVVIWFLSHVQQPKVGVPLINARGQTPIGLGQSFDGGNRLGAREDARDFHTAAVIGGLAGELAH